MRMYDLFTKGIELHDFNTVKEFKNYFGTTSQKKLERMLKNEIKQLELNMYDKILEEQRKTVKDLINDLDSGNTELSAVFKKRVNESIDSMNLIQLLEILNQIMLQRLIQYILHHLFLEDQEEKKELIVLVIYLKNIRELLKNILSLFLKN